MAAMMLYDAADAGSDGYPKAWHDSIKHDVRELAEHRCVRCKHPYRQGEHGRGEWTPCDEGCGHKGQIRYRQDGWGDWHYTDESIYKAGSFAAEAFQVEARYRILTVHHLDGNKLNCRWWNLCALCQRCHLTIQGRVKMHRPYFLEHSDWFKPYAAGFYASSILGEELSREEVVVRLEELLSLALAATH
jgi:hypothetical protein